MKKSPTLTASRTGNERESSWGRKVNQQKTENQIEGSLESKAVLSSVGERTSCWLLLAAARVFEEVLANHESTRKEKPKRSRVGWGEVFEVFNKGYDRKQLNQRLGSDSCFTSLQSLNVKQKLISCSSSRGREFEDAGFYFRL